MEVGDGLAWHVVRTQPKREKVATQYLRNALDLEVCCPQVRYKKSTARGKVWWVEAMFPGYIFVRFNCHEHLRAVCGAQGVMKVLQFGDFVPTIDASFVDRLREELNEGEQIVIQHDVNEGDFLEVSQGPMAGHSGQVLEVKAAHERVKLLIEFLGEEREVEFDLADLLLARRPDM